jgi:probable rRNA maturation factor
VRAHEISSANETGAVLDLGWLERTAARVVESELDEPVEMSFIIVDDAEIQRLNREWRGYDEPTDVLSFGLSDRSKPAADDEELFDFPKVENDVLHLGEVLISLPTAERQAAEHSRQLETELRHLLIHGILHLIGYDHAEPDEERLMRGREELLLAETVPREL